MLLFAAFSLCSSCALLTADKKNEKLVKGCVVPTEQNRTIAGQWKASPIPIAFKEGDFDETEIQDIVQAARTWNSFFQASREMTVLDYGSDSSPRITSAAKPTSICSQGIIQGTAFTGQVVIYKSVPWPYDRSAVALTSFCPSPAKPLPNIYMAIMELNYQDFFVSGKKLPDLQSIALHEFGHLMGLDHSCDTHQKDGFPFCGSPSLLAEFFYAVMYPVVNFSTSGRGEVRQKLQKNDQGRANCLFDGV